MNTVTTHLLRFYQMPSISALIERFFQQLSAYIRTQYTALVSYLDTHCARKEFQLIKTIQPRLRKRPIMGSVCQ